MEEDKKEEIKIVKVTEELIKAKHCRNWSKWKAWWMNNGRNKRIDYYG